MTCSSYLTVGTWPIEVAREYPSAHVIGMDKSTCQPIARPSNCEFKVGDIRTDLRQFAEGSFDLVHSR